jgi:uracil-DNA glycosylase
MGQPHVRVVIEMAPGPRGQNRFLSTAWWKLLEDELGRPYLTELLAFVDTNGAGVFPPKDDVFRALELTPPGETKAVIVGQDPYHGPGQAHGLCFSVRRGFKPLPRSLGTILRVLEGDDFRASDDGNLEPWGEEGVLLLNTALTVLEGKPGSHSARWRLFTNAVIRIAARDPEAVFLLWGSHAQKKKPIITATRGSQANILESSHPAPPACYRPCGDGPSFVESHPFRNTNKLLEPGSQINWNLA